jgi:hypothetical protein
MERLRRKQRSLGHSSDEVNDEELEAEADTLIQYQVPPLLPPLLICLVRMRKSSTLSFVHSLFR